VKNAERWEHTLTTRCPSPGMLILLWILVTVSIYASVVIVASQITTSVDAREAAPLIGAPPDTVTPALPAGQLNAPQVRRTP
jgi:hypothetical protein